MSITHPNQLVEQFKKSGEFDRLRRELFAEFQKGDHIPTFNKKTEDVVKQRFASMKTRSFIGFGQDDNNLRTELMQEIQRYPYVETTVNDLRIFSDNVFNDDLEDSIMRLLKQENGVTVNGESNGLKQKERHQDSPRDTKQEEIKDKLEDKMEIDESSSVNGKETRVSPFPRPQTTTNELSSVSADEEPQPSLLSIPNPVKEDSSSGSPQTRRPTSALSSLSPIDMSSRSSPAPAASSASVIPSTIRVPNNTVIPGPVASLDKGSIDAQNDGSGAGALDSQNESTRHREGGHLDTIMADTEAA